MGLSDPDTAQMLYYLQLGRSFTWNAHWYRKPLRDGAISHIAKVPQTKTYLPH